MTHDNYWNTLADQVRAGEPSAIRALPKEMERYLRIIVRSALRRPSDSSRLARLANDVARQFSPDGAVGGGEPSPTLVKRVARTMALEMTRRLQPAALETIVA